MNYKADHNKTYCQETFQTWEHLRLFAKISLLVQCIPLNILIEVWQKLKVSIMTWFPSKALWRPSKCGVSQINCFCSTDSISISNTNIGVQKFNITNFISISNTNITVQKNITNFISISNTNVALEKFNIANSISISDTNIKVQTFNIPNLESISNTKLNI